MKLTDLTLLFADAPEVMTTGEVCGLIRASESYLYRLVSENRLPCFCVGVHYRFLKRDILQCLKDEAFRDSTVCLS